MPSSRLADTGTGRRGSRSGRTDRVAARVPHQVDGSAIGASARSPTVSAASRASRRPPPPLIAGLVAGSAAVRRSSLTSPPSDSVRSGRPSTFSTVTPSSPRNRDGWSPSSSGEATAVTTSRSRARVQAT